MEIRRLFIYPVKSLLPVEVRYAEVTSEGFRFDRQYVLIKAPRNATSGPAEHLTIKTLFTLALFQPSIHDGWSRLTIQHTKAQPESSITIPLTPSPLYCAQSPSFQVSIFGTTAVGIDMGDLPASFFSKHLRLDVRLLFIGGDGQRAIPPAAFMSKTVALPQEELSRYDSVTQGQKIRFADAAPFLVTSSASEREALSRLPLCNQSEDVIIRFRPNIHIGVDAHVVPFDEDDWDKIVVYSDSDNSQKAVIHCIFKTARCLSLNVDLTSGKVANRDQQLYGLLARDRRVSTVFPHKPVFGQYAFAEPVGARLRVGDCVSIIKREISSPNG